MADTNLGLGAGFIDITRIVGWAIDDMMTSHAASCMVTLRRTHYAYVSSSDLITITAVSDAWKILKTR